MAKAGFNKQSGSTSTGFGPPSGKTPKKGWLKQNWGKACLAGATLFATLAYGAEAYHHTSKSDFMDKYSIPGFMFNEVCYDIGDVGIAISSLWNSEEEKVHDGKYMLIRDEDSLKVLCCHPRHLDKSFTEIAPNETHQRIYEWQTAYVKEQIGDKATEIGMMLSHDRKPVVHFVSESEILGAMDPERRARADELRGMDYANFLGEFAARELMDVSEVTHNSDQKSRNSTRFKEVYHKVDISPE